MASVIDLISESHQHLPIGWLSLDSEQQISALNPRAEQMLNLSIGEKLQKRLNPESLDLLQTVLEGEITQCEIKFLTTDNQQIQATFSLDPRSHELEEQFGLFIVGTTQQNIFENLLQNNRDPERKFIHELSNALTSTMGYSELINMTLSEADLLVGEDMLNVKRYQNEVFTGLRRVDQLIKDRKKARREHEHLFHKHVLLIGGDCLDDIVLLKSLETLHCHLNRVESIKQSLAVLVENPTCDLIILDASLINEAAYLETIHDSFEQSPRILILHDQQPLAQFEALVLMDLHFAAQPQDSKAMTTLLAKVLTAKNSIG